MSWYAVHTVFSVSDGTTHGRRDLCFNDVIECDDTEQACDRAIEMRLNSASKVNGFVREQGVVECEDRHEAMDLTLKW